MEILIVCMFGLTGYLMFKTRFGGREEFGLGPIPDPVKFEDGKQRHRPARRKTRAAELPQLELFGKMDDTSGKARNA